MQKTIHGCAITLFLTTSNIAYSAQPPSPVYLAPPTTQSESTTHPNSIRDDIAVFILSNYPTTPQRAAATQLASFFQATLLANTQNPSQVRSLSLQGTRAVNCVYSQFDGKTTQQPAKVIEQLRSLTTNTKPKLLAYLAYSKALDGIASTLPDGNTCD